MSWTYDPTNLITTTASGRKDIVRLIVGDTQTAEQQLQDEEIAYLLTSNDNSIFNASKRAVLALIAKFSREGDIWMGHTRVERSQRVRNYRTLLERLETDPTLLMASMFVGGVSVAANDALRSDSDFVQPSFSIGMDDIGDGENTGED